MSDNPFLEPDDNERTVLFRPVPGGRQPAPTPPSDAPPHARGGAAPAAAGPASPKPPPAGEPIGKLETGQSPLIAAATPLLQLLGRLRDTFSPPDPGELRLRSIQAVRAFEASGRAAGLPTEVLHPARYALCASVDDVVLHTPWGAASPWVQASLVSTFHQEVVSGVGFFDQLTALKREPARHLMLLELMYMCLSLGYQGQYRLSRQGPAQLEHLREDLYQTIVRLRPPYEQGLSPRWKGVLAPYLPARAMVPVWVMAMVAVAVVAVWWGVLSARLNGASEQAFNLAAGLPPLQMPGLERPPSVAAPRPAAPPPAPEPSAVAQTLHRFLQPEIDAREVIVWETPQTVEVRIFNRGMFASGSATVQPAFMSLLERIGEALNEESGRVLLTGHTDNQPIRDAPFPSNYQLSVARAKAASVIILQRLRDPARLVIEGRADSQPIDSNDTPAGREQNRRIDVILQRQG